MTRLSSKSPFFFFCLLWLFLIDSKCSSDGRWVCLVALCGLLCNFCPHLLSYFYLNFMSPNNLKNIAIQSEIKKSREKGTKFPVIELWEVLGISMFGPAEQCCTRTKGAVGATWGGRHKLLFNYMMLFSTRKRTPFLWFLIVEKHNWVEQSGE